ncbi:TatD family hydrolase [Halalkalicoccus sp. NIPERK01]|uniref:TatD family hydrolase n=1 Tax=Halalkalicoccus sp. NIPERK01 TaxID=3053469 RepID=UPI00256EE1F8|nr:TatD family hydrolase [Halalkalicoccus sp. NIPERK01]MDL5363464.1 TatD family hydrolase [Halalkalicoccus sp. NIPERK01]
MTDSNTHPSSRPLGISPDELGDRPTAQSSRITRIPWIDSHQHTQTLSWNDQEKFALSGAQAVVMIAANYHWSPYRPVDPDDVRFLWDLAIKWVDFLNRKHLFDTYVAIGIHTVARVTDCDALLEALPAYCDLDEVVAIGETGIEPVQYASRWPVEEQKPIVREQMNIAHDTGVPLILHTPTKKSTAGASSERGWGGLGLSEPDPAFEYDTPKLEATEMDVELLDESKLSDERVIVDHGAPSIVEYVMESTDCYLGFSVSSPLKGVTTRDIAAAIETYGSDRIIVDSDTMGYRDCDLFCIPRTIQELYRLGIDEEELLDVVYRNPNEVLSLDYTI